MTLPPPPPDYPNRTLPAPPIPLRGKFLCIHGHFYQPPRENPWLGVIEEQPGAAPFHDWNMRITNECYGPNTAARIVNSQNEILDIRNNYEKISFNFGPTLLSWMEEHNKDVYEEIIEADRRSVVKRSGHGNALAQVYNHVIMPLATRRDKETQVIWGMEDFRHRFGRDPEGMWLAETAVDLESLEILAANGIKFTLLAPRQAKMIRDIESSNPNWMSVDGGRIDPSRPYLCSLPSGKSIVLFFYDGPISQAVAFENLLVNGDRFAERLISGFSEGRRWPQLVHIATDGESYGHHHRHGEMALAYSLYSIETRGAARLTNYGEFLGISGPPRCEVQIWEDSSWSCVHGVERWKSNCGCHSGQHPGWHQKWRAPLRATFDHVKARADDVFEKEGARLFHDPWGARNDYVHLLLQNGAPATGDFIERHVVSPLDGDGRRTALRLLETQRQSMLMYTSCAWFFDELSGIETLQTLRYAARLIQLLRREAPELERQVLDMLAKAPSNNARFKEGATIWKTQIRPQVVDLHRLVANFAIAYFDRYHEGTHEYYGVRIEEKESERSSFGDVILKLMRLSAVSRSGSEQLDATVCVLHLGGHDFQCRMGPPMEQGEYEALRYELFTTFSRRSLAEVVRAIDRSFGGRDYALADLFMDVRQELLAGVTQKGFERYDSMLVLMYDENKKLMEYLRENRAPLPAGFSAVAEYVLRSRMEEELEKFLTNHESSRATEIAREARELGVGIVNNSLRSKLANALERVFHDLALAPTGGMCRISHELLDILELLSVDLDLWEAQNICFALVHNHALPSRLAKQTRYHRRLNAPSFPALRELASRLRISPEPINAEDTVVSPAAEPTTASERQSVVVE